ncbi:MAG TPA: AAA family ATPase, partial [Bacteroidales bacterium]
MMKYLTFTPTSDQTKLLDLFSDFVLNQNDRGLLLLKGYAGTGKTTMISIFIKMLQEFKVKTILLAPTGRAAKVLSGYSETPATTIHKKIYRQKSSKDAFGEFSLDKNLHTNTFFIVDEASMLSAQNFESSIFGSGNLLQDLISYVYNEKNCKLILVGDVAQLPPVGLPISQAMDKRFLHGFNVNVVECELKEVVRQSKESGILTNATSIRGLIDTENFDHPRFFINGMPDVFRIAGNELLDTLSTVYRKYGQDDTIVICRSNKIANKYNQGIRNHVLFREEELSAGDYMMVVKNNYFWL